MRAAISEADGAGADLVGVEPGVGDRFARRHRRQLGDSPHRPRELLRDARDLLSARRRGEARRQVRDLVPVVHDGDAVSSRAERDEGLPVRLADGAHDADAGDGYAAPLHPSPPAIVTTCPVM